MLDFGVEEEPIMAKLLIAFLVVLTAVLIAYFGLSSVGLDVKSATELAGIFGVAVPWVHSYMEKNYKTGWAFIPKEVVSLEGFALPWYWMIMYGTLIVTCITQFSAGLSGLFLAFGNMNAGLPVPPPEQVLAQTMFVMIAIVYPCMFLTGSWVGTRADKYEIYIVLGIALISNLVGHSLTLLLMSEGDFASLIGEKSLSNFSEMIGLSSAILALLGLLGYWRGRRNRLARYLRYLLGMIDDGTKRAIIDLAYQEARGARQRPYPVHQVPVRGQAQLAMQ